MYLRCNVIVFNVRVEFYFLCIVKKSVASRLRAFLQSFILYNLEARLILLIDDEYHIRYKYRDPWGNNFEVTVNRHALIIFPQVKATRNCREFAKRGIQASSPPQRERFAGLHQGDFLCENRRIRKRKKKRMLKAKMRVGSANRVLYPLNRGRRRRCRKISSACNKWLETSPPLV